MARLEEPHPPTLGTLQAMMHEDELAEKLRKQGGMAFIVAKLQALNQRYCWTPGLRNKEKTNWGQVNRHIWRIFAMYQGVDCFLAGWLGAYPNQKLWPTKTFHLPAETPLRIGRWHRHGPVNNGYSLPPASPEKYNAAEWHQVCKVCGRTYSPIPGYPDDGVCSVDCRESRKAS